MNLLLFIYVTQITTFQQKPPMIISPDALVLLANNPSADEDPPRSTQVRSTSLEFLGRPILRYIRIYAITPLSDYQINGLL